MTTADPPAGFEVLPIARIVKSGRADSPPELNAAFIPPVLAVDAFPPVHAGVVQAAYDRIGTKLAVSPAGRGPRADVRQPQPGRSHDPRNSSAN